MVNMRDKGNSNRLTSRPYDSVWGRFLSKLRRYYVFYLFVIPTLLWYFLFRYLPMTGIYIAFTKYNGVGDMFQAKPVGLKWFVSFFNSPYAKITITNTLRLSLYYLLTFPLPIVVALLINEIKNEKFKKISQTIMYAPHFISLVILVAMMNLFFDLRGIVNTVLDAFGMDKIQFLSSNTAYPHMFVWSAVWQQLGWNTIIYTAALSSVDPGLHEAAALDGCSRFQRILHVNLPSIAPTIIITLILKVGDLMTVSTEKGILMRNDLNMAVAETIGTYVYERGLLSGDFGYAAAVGLFLNVVNLILLVSVNKVSKKVTDTSLF